MITADEHVNQNKNGLLISLETKFGTKSREHNFIRVHSIIKSLTRENLTNCSQMNNYVQTVAQDNSSFIHTHTHMHG